MKIKLKLFVILLAMAISCKEDDPIEDPIYEFVSFKEAGPVDVNEFTNSTEAYPVVIQLLAFEPYSEDITIHYKVTGNNAQEGVDFSVMPPQSISVKAGSLTSDTIWVKTFDNGEGATSDGSFDIALESVSKSDIKIGLGLTTPKQMDITFNIIDDECPLTADIYSASLDNLINIDGKEEGTNDATGVLAGNTVLINGDLCWYKPMDNALVLTLVPSESSATRGTVTFGTQFMGTAKDGYEYTFAQVGTGTFDVCSGTITITYDTSYRGEGETGDWTAWQRVVNTFKVP